MSSNSSNHNKTQHRDKIYVLDFRPSYILILFLNFTLLRTLDYIKLKRELYIEDTVYSTVQYESISIFRENPQKKGEKNIVELYQVAT